jgi:hypothetical protein
MRHPDSVVETSTARPASVAERPSLERNVLDGPYQYPGRRLADRVGWRRAPSLVVVVGLRELGEPPRKALVVDLAEPQLRARSVGLYYLARSVSIAPAGSPAGSSGA